MTTPFANYDRVRALLQEASSLLLKHDPASAAQRISLFPDLVALLDEITSREWSRIGAAQELREAIKEFRNVILKAQSGRALAMQEAALTIEFGAAIRKVNAALARMESSVPPIERRRG